MIIALSIQFLAQIILGAIDAIRIRLAWGKTNNINHNISISIAIVFCSIEWVFDKELLYLYLPLCVGMRFLFYSPWLNVFRNRKPYFLYQDLATSAKTDKIFAALPQRIFGFSIVVIVLIINSIL